MNQFMNDVKLRHVFFLHAKFCLCTANYQLSASLWTNVTNCWYWSCPSCIKAIIISASSLLRYTKSYSKYDMLTNGGKLVSILFVARHDGVSLSRTSGIIKDWMDIQTAWTTTPSTSATSPSSYAKRSGTRPTSSAKTFGNRPTSCAKIYATSPTSYSKGSAIRSMSYAKICARGQATNYAKTCATGQGTSYATSRRNYAISTTSFTIRASTAAAVFSRRVR